MSTLNASNVDSQGIIYSLNRKDMTATIAGSINPKLPDNIGLLYKHLQRKFYIKLSSNIYFMMDPRKFLKDPSKLMVDRLINFYVRNIYFDDPTMLFTADISGHIITVANPNYCLYHKSDYLTLADMTKLSKDDLNQYWCFKNNQLCTQSDMTMMLAQMSETQVLPYSFEQSNDYTHTSFMLDDVFIPGIDALIDNGVIEDRNKDIVIKRGVIDENGEIYKIIGLEEDALSYDRTIKSMTFPFHTSGEIDSLNTYYPLLLMYVVFKDGVYEITTDDRIDYMMAWENAAPPMYSS